MNTADHPVTPEKAAQRVLDWLRQFHTMIGMDPEVVHRANHAPLNVSDLTLLLAAQSDFRRSETDRQKVRDLLLPVLEKHRHTRDDVDVVESGRIKASYLAKVAVGLIEHLGFENETEVQRLGRALESTQQALIRMEQARDELRIAIAQAAGVDLNEISEIDVDFVREVRELGTEVKRLEENEDFTTRVLHAVLGCCDGRDSCGSRTVEDAFDAFRRGEVPQVDIPVEVRQTLISRAREYARQRDTESGGEHDIDDAYWDDMADFQTKGLRIVQGASHRDLVFALRRQIRAWKAEKRTGKELGLPNEIARDDGYASGRIDAAHELEYLIDEAKRKGNR